MPKTSLDTALNAKDHGTPGSSQGTGHSFPLHASVSPQWKCESWLPVRSTRFLSPSLSEGCFCCGMGTKGGRCCGGGDGRGGQGAWDGVMGQSYQPESWCWRGVSHGPGIKRSRKDPWGLEKQTGEVVSTWVQPSWGMPRGTEGAGESHPGWRSSSRSRVRITALTRPPQPRHLSLWLGPLAPRNAKHAGTRGHRTAMGTRGYIHPVAPTTDTMHPQWTLPHRIHGGDEACQRVYKTR